MSFGQSNESTRQAWGQEGCPLVPAALRRLAGDAPAPASLEAAFGRPVKLAELDRAIWSTCAAHVGKVGLAELVKALTPLVREHRDMQLFDLETALPVELDALALQPQTAKFVAAAMQGRALDPTTLTFGDLLDMPQIGPRRSLEVACALEAHIDGRVAAVMAETLAAPNECFDATIAVPEARFDETLAVPEERFDETIAVPVEDFDETIAVPAGAFGATGVEADGFDTTLVPPIDASDVAEAPEAVSADADEAPPLSAPPPPLDPALIDTVVRPPGERRERDRRQAGRTPREIKTFFRVLAAWASGERGEQTLKNALPQPKPGWPPELVQLWKRVRYCSAPDLAGTLRDRYSVPDLVQQAFVGCDQRHRLILQARVLTTSKPTSLEALAAALCMSVYDVRNLQQAALAYLERLQTKAFRPVTGRARMIRQRLGCAVPERDPVLKKALEWVVSDFTDFPDLEFVRELMLWLAGPYRLKDRWYVTSADLPMRTVQALLERRNRDGVIETSVVRQVLSGLAIHPKYHEAWIERIGEFVSVRNGLMSASDRFTGPLPAVPPR